MSKVVKLKTFQPESFKICLRHLYRELDRTVLPANFDMHAYENFFLRVRGKFLAISRKKKKISLQTAAGYLGIPFASLLLIENGRAPITDAAFMDLCKYYGTQQEALGLREKIERALNPKSFGNSPNRALKMKTNVIPF